MEDPALSGLPGAGDSGGPFINEKKVSSMTKITLLLCTAAVLSGCAMSNTAPVTGFVYNGSKGTYGATSNPVAAKTGQSCSSSILGIIGSGDASAAAAAKAGGITKIATVDSDNFGILGIYATSCTVVTGE